MSNVTAVLRTEGVQTSSFNSESVEDARYDAQAMIRSGAATSAEILVDGEIVERLPGTNGTTVAELAREYDMESHGLRAFADDLLDGLDDVTPMSADVETTIRYALAQVPTQD